MVHPYGGRGSRAQSALGNRGQVERAHSYTGKPVYVTEVGWPTATKFPPTGDSLQWTQPEQAANIYGFVNWARSTGYVGGVFIYGYRDAEANGPAEYGVVTHSGVKKNRLDCVAGRPRKESPAPCAPDDTGAAQANERPR